MKNQTQEPTLKGDSSMGETRTRAAIEGELAIATEAKAAAVCAGDFELASDLRDAERRLQHELRAVGGEGLYRIRIDRPDGTHAEASSPSWADALELVGFTDMTDELRLLLSAARLLDKAYRGGRVVR